MEIVAQKTFLEIQDEAYAQLHTIYDPEIPVNIYDLGLVYEVNVDADNNIQVIMTLTAPNCPAAESLPNEVKEKLSNIDGANEIKVEVTFDPPWDQDMMSETAKLELGFL